MRGSPVAGAPTSSSSGTRWARASGRSSSRFGRRCPDSSRESVLTEMPVAADRSARVMSRCWRSARSRGPTAASTLSERAVHHNSLPLRQESLANLGPRDRWCCAEVINVIEQQDRYIRRGRGRRWRRRPERGAAAGAVAPLGARHRRAVSRATRPPPACTGSCPATASIRWSCWSSAERRSAATAGRSCDGRVSSAAARRTTASR